MEQDRGARAPGREEEWEEEAWGEAGEEAGWAETAPAPDRQENASARVAEPG
ncbi:MAG: hypothetical protein V1789_01025 [PVC group bacterium]